VLRRRDVRIAATEVDERLAARRGGGPHPREQAHEVLLGQTIEPTRALHSCK
jgi:hypothetical protein